MGAARQLEVGAATPLPVVIARLVKWIEDFCKAVDFWASRGGAYDRYPLQQDRAVPVLLKPPGLLEFARTVWSQCSQASSVGASG